MCLLTLLYTIFSIVLAENNQDFVTLFGAHNEKVESIIFSNFYTYAVEVNMLADWNQKKLELEFWSSTSLETYCQQNCAGTEIEPIVYKECLENCSVKNEVTIKKSKFHFITEIVSNYVSNLVAIYGLGVYGLETEVLFSKGDLERLRSIYLPALIEMWNDVKQYFCSGDQECNEEMFLNNYRLNFEASILKDHIGDNGNVDFYTAVVNSSIFKTLLINIANQKNTDFIKVFGVNYEKVESIIFSNFSTYAIENDLLSQWNNEKSEFEFYSTFTTKLFCEEDCTEMKVGESMSFEECFETCLALEESETYAKSVKLGALAFYIREYVSKLIAIYGLGVYGFNTEALFSKCDLEKLMDIYLPALIEMWSDIKEYVCSEYELCSEETFLNDYGLNFEETILKNHITENGNVDFYNAVKNSSLFITLTKSLTGYKNADFNQEFGVYDSRVKSIIFSNFDTYAIEDSLQNRWNEDKSEVEFYSSLTMETFCKRSCTEMNPNDPMPYERCVELCYVNGETNAKVSRFYVMTTFISDYVSNLIAIYGLGVHGVETEVFFSKRDLERLRSIYLPTLLEMWNDVKNFFCREDQGCNEESYLNDFGLNFEKTILKKHIADNGNVDFYDDVRNSNIFKTLIKNLVSQKNEELGEVLLERVPSVFFNKFQTYANEKPLKSRFDNETPVIEAWKKVKTLDDFCNVSCMGTNDTELKDCLSLCKASIFDTKKRYKSYTNNTKATPTPDNLSECAAITSAASMTADLSANLIAIYGLGVHGNSEKVIFSKTDLEKYSNSYVPGFVKQAKSVCGESFDESVFKETCGFNFESTVLAGHIAEEGNVDFVDAVKNSDVFINIIKYDSGLSPGAIAGIVIACVIVVLAVILIPTLLILKKKKKINKETKEKDEEPKDKNEKQKNDAEKETETSSAGSNGEELETEITVAGAN